MTYHFNTQDQFHVSNIGLEDLVQRFGQQDVTPAARLLADCPVVSHQQNVKVRKNSRRGFSYQLIQEDPEPFSRMYARFFVEIVCESYFTGNTFFVTEKTWRPIMLGTPFVVQGSQWFLKRLKKLGFRTFDQWWDEGYQEDPWDHQVKEIIKIIDRLARLDVTELHAMYDDMLPILQHNQQRFHELRDQDFETLRHA